jgi:hypothetical protein
VGQVSVLRLYLLRAMYALMAVGLSITVGPLLVHHPVDVDPLRGVVRSVLGAVILLALLGIRYPIKMLPLLLFELTWKSLWLLLFFLPRWTAHQLTPDVWDNFTACLMGVVLCPIVIPWRYAFETYFKARGDRWHDPSQDSPGGAAAGSAR